MVNMDPDRLLFLQKWRHDLVSQKQEIEKRIDYIDAEINYTEDDSSEGTVIELASRAESPKRRVRGVLAAARRAVDQFSGPFTRHQLQEKLEEDGEFAHKKITTSNIRNAIRLLKKTGIIKVEKEATATQTATYIKAA